VVWFLIGVAIYAGYGYRHSLLHPATPRTRDDADR
jgi:hypothetical protein